jgi:hypothetical protein
MTIKKWQEKAKQRAASLIACILQGRKIAQKALKSQRPAQTNAKSARKRKTATRAKRTASFFSLFLFLLFLFLLFFLLVTLYFFSVDFNALGMNFSNQNSGWSYDRRE